MRAHREKDLINHAGEEREERDLVDLTPLLGWLVDMNMQRRRRRRFHKKKKNGGWDPLQNEHQRKGR